MWSPKLFEQLNNETIFKYQQKKTPLKNNLLTQFFLSIFRLIAELEKNKPDQVDIFKTNMNKAMKDILGRFKELQFFTGESMDCDGMVCMMEYRDIDGKQIPVLMFFKHGLEEEKF